MRFMMIILLCLAQSVILWADSNIYHTKISDLEIYIMSLEKMSPPVEKLIPNDKSDKDFIATLAPKLAQNNQNVMLLKHKNIVALVDTGFSHNFESLKTHLSNLHLKPSDITHIIITHAHGDHIGGILQNGTNAFPSATLLIDKNEYDFWVNGKDFSGSAKNVAKLAKSALLAFDKVIFFDESLNKTLGFKNSDKSLQIRTIKAYGHTPGHNMIEILGENKRLIFVADLFHALEIQRARPQIAIQYDINPSDATKTRIDFLKSLKDNTQIIGGHFPFVEPIAF